MNHLNFSKTRKCSKLYNNILMAIWSSKVRPFELKHCFFGTSVRRKNMIYKWTFKNISTEQSRKNESVHGRKLFYFHFFLCRVNQFAYRLCAPQFNHAPEIDIRSICILSKRFIRDSRSFFSPTRDILRSFKALLAAILVSVARSNNAWNILLEWQWNDSKTNSSWKFFSDNATSTRLKIFVS